MNDTQGLVNHIKALIDSLTDWSRYQSFTLDELQRDRDKQNMVLHSILIAIQSGLDIANHIIADKNLSKPSTYRESFEILAQSGLIDHNLASNLADLASFRNIVVHSYWKMDFKEVYAILQEEYINLENFRKWVKDLLAQERKS